MTTPPRSPRASLALRALLLVGACAAALACAASGCALSDLRPDTLTQDGPDAQARALGAERLRALADRHGGRARWAAAPALIADIDDTWFSAIQRMVAMPWPDNGQRMRLSAHPLSDNGRLDFTSGAWQGRAWGIQHWRTWRADPSTPPAFTQDDDVKFWIPTLLYFIEAPFRLQEADVAIDLGDADIQGRTYHRVFLSWGTHAPQDTIDQYVAWIDAETGLLAWLQYTVRDVMGTLTAMMAYTEYRDIDGFQVAFRMANVPQPGGPSGDSGHRMNVYSLDLSTPLPAGTIVLDPNRRAHK